MLGDGFPGLGLFGVRVNEFFYQSRNCYKSVSFTLLLRLNFCAAFIDPFIHRNIKAHFQLYYFFHFFYCGKIYTA